MNTAGIDRALAALAAHPNSELRFYNPFVLRGARILGFRTGLTRLNHRVTNKSFIADGQVSAGGGGRNIANEHFGAGGGMVFADLDVVAVGAPVREGSREFDLYGDSPSACPAARFAGATGARLHRPRRTSEYSVWISAACWATLHCPPSKR